MSGHSLRAFPDAPAVTEDGDGRRCYLLFAGSQQAPRGGLGDLVGTFSSEATARRAFRIIRLEQTSQRSWAQLAVVEGDHGIRPLCWFGIGAMPARKRASVARPEIFMDHQAEGGVTQVATSGSRSAPGQEAESTPPRRRFRRITVWLRRLVVVGATIVGLSCEMAVLDP